MAAGKEQWVVVKRFGSRFCRPVSRCLFKFLKTEWWVSLYVSLFGGIGFRFWQFFIILMVLGIWSLFDAHFKNLERTKPEKFRKEMGPMQKISKFKESSCSLMSPNGRKRISFKKFANFTLDDLYGPGNSICWALISWPFKGRFGPHLGMGFRRGWSWTAVINLLDHLSHVAAISMQG